MKFLTKGIYFAKLLYSVQLGKVITPLHNVQMDTTWMCNLKCKMCEWDDIQIDRKTPVDFNLFKRVIQEFMELGLRKINLGVSGEPMMHPEITEIIKFLSERKLEISVVTNLSYSIDKFIESLRKVSNLIVSIDAATPDTYSKVRTGGDFERVLSNVARLSDMGINVIASYVIEKNNYKEINEFIKLMHKIKVKKVHFGIVNNINHEILKQVMLSESEYDEMLENIEEGIRTSKVLGISSDGMLRPGFAISHRERFLKRLYEIRQVPHEIDSIPCYAMYFFATVTPKGEVYPCCDAQKIPWMKVGNLSSHSFKEIWKGEIYNNLRSKFKNPGKPIICERCPLEDFNKTMHQYLKWI